MGCNSEIKGPAPFHECNRKGQNISFQKDIKVSMQKNVIILHPNCSSLLTTILKEKSKKQNMMCTTSMLLQCFCYSNSVILMLYPLYFQSLSPKTKGPEKMEKRVITRSRKLNSKSFCNSWLAFIKLP